MQHSERLRYSFRNVEKVDLSTIIIAHRFATLKIVDKIVIMKKGKILDVGTHDELIKRNKYYHKLCEKQMV